MSEALQRHVESSIPGHHLWSGRNEHSSELSELGFRALPHVGGLIELPKLALGDFIISSRDNRLGHVCVGLVVPDLLVGELVLNHLSIGGEGVKSALALVVHRSSEEHNEGSCVEVADWKLNGHQGTSLKSKYPTPHARTPFWRFQYRSMVWSRFPARYLSMYADLSAVMFLILNEGGVYLGKLLLGFVVEVQEGLLFLADEHQAVVIITFNISGELDVGYQKVVVLVLSGLKGTCSSLVLNQSLARPYLTGIINQILL